MNTREAAIGQWPKILSHYGLPPVTGKRHFKGECPLCGEKGKYRCDDLEGRGTFICTCDRGDGWHLLTRTQGKDIKSLMDEVDQIIGFRREPGQHTQKVVATVDQRRERVLANFPRLPQIKNTPAEQYLNGRGIYELPANDVRYGSRQKYHGLDLQAMCSLMTDEKAMLCYLHRTYLNGNKKADVIPNKKTDGLQNENYLRHTRSVAIRLFPVASTLGIAEGIETALSCKQLYGVNTWSTANAGFMKKFIAPPGVTHLIIFTDMDPNSATGHSAAFECAHINLLAKNDIQKVTVRWPDTGDFNDLIQNGEQVRELVFYKKAAA
ncbi:DNA primase [Erwinia psidii]|uniref:DUF7146 domain-containing protein n=1 Tax=Erwinia psidii TaxID=69224 RepID=UPI00226B99E5|nr:toprim domain-containing protein [Erwinia psidii]MCX8967388.1 DNA primase [Erwinia psidii]